MASPYYRFYRNRIYELTKTLVVKSSATADAINRNLSAYGHTIEPDETTWKYYMNLAGEYHSTDQLMYVTSMDTLTEIPFTKDSLEIHRATKEAYRYGTRYYNELVGRYPKQRALILGILDPVDKVKAIEAEDGDILHYDKALVEPQEYSFIHKLETWIKAYMVRWEVSGYNLTDSLYPSAKLGIMFALLPQEVENIRLEACGTNEVHSYHIREFLASNNALDEFLPYLTLKQALFLYRNIKYIRRNAGKKEIFQLLLQFIITERNLPLAEYVMEHNTLGLPDEVLPNVELVRRPLNNHPGDGSNPYRQIDYVLALQDGEARSNNVRYFENLQTISQRMKHAQINRLPTKVLESALLDTSDSVYYNSTDILLNHWIYLAANNRFNTIITVTNPYTGTRTPLTAKEAFVTYIYAYNKAREQHLTTIPMMVAVGVRKPSIPSLEAIKAITVEGYVTDAQIHAIRDNHPAMGVYISVAAFRDFCEEVYVRMNEQRLIYARQDHPKTRAMLLNATNLHYHTVECDMYAGDDYEQWLQDRGLDLEDLSPLDLDLLASSILTDISGGQISRKNTSLAELQGAMLRLMSRLSSYNLQYIQTINADNFSIVELTTPRFHDHRSIYKSEIFWHNSPVDVMSVKHRPRTLCPIQPKLPTVLGSVSSVPNAHYEIGIGGDWKIKHMTSNAMMVPFPKSSFDYDTGDTPE
jgi:hypothetical protein